MKNIFLSIHFNFAVALLISTIVQAQVNYVRTVTAAAPEQNEITLMSKSVKDAKTVTHYIDGIGRLTQIVLKQGSLHNRNQEIADLTSPIVYDEFGRETYKYSPFVANNAGGNTSINDGAYKANPLIQQEAFNSLQYPTETNFYYKTNFESSPLNRPTNNYGPGTSWAGSESNSNPALKRNIQINYLINTVLDDVKMWDVVNSANIGGLGSYQVSTNGNGSYTPGELYKYITIDEHKKQRIEFKDKSGKIVLNKVQIGGMTDDGTGVSNTDFLCTYYLYDDKNNLRCIIQPEGVKKLAETNYQLSSVILEEQCFRYEYDQGNRLIIKKVPGSAEIRMVYDKRDRMVMFQDANMRNQQKWMYTTYDKLNRPLSNGLLADPINFNFHRFHLDASITTTMDYPNISNYSIEELSKTFYDNYDWLSNYATGLSATYDNSFDQFLLQQTNAWPHPQQNFVTTQVNGRATGGRVKILGTTNEYLYGVVFYDEKGRVIQSQYTNSTGGKDNFTTQYTWAGQPLVTVQKTVKAGNFIDETIVVTKISHDDLGRVVKTEKKISNSLVRNSSGILNGMSNYKTLAEYHYDKLGQLVEKLVGNKENSTDPLAKFSYEYNVRGWLTSVNKNFVSTPLVEGNPDDRYFGIELGYDKNGFGSFNTKEYNGNLSGSIWRSVGDGLNRKYDYNYDAANRLLQAEFTQYTNGSFNQTSGVNFNVKMGDGVNALGNEVTPNSAYDYNGNIKQMQQWGLKLNTSSQIDNLAYSYKINSNKLKGVSDAYNDNNSRLGDFKFNPATKTTTDYDYDDNGNVIRDANRNVQSITYNHLNLPIIVIISGKGSISYKYDASGKKLEKKIQEDPSVANNNKTITRTIKYVNGLNYESKTTFPQDQNTEPDYIDILRFLPHEEGRIKFKPLVGSTDASLVYDYMIKDHLGNVRMVLTEEKEIDTYPAASLETANLASEKTIYSIPDDLATRVDRNSVLAYPTDNTTSPNDFIHKLSGNGTKVGSSITLKVMAGDKFNLKVSSWYKSNNVIPNDPNSPILQDLVNGLLAGVGGAITSSHGGATISQIQNSGVLVPNINNFLTSQVYDPARPKAFLSWVLFDEQFNFVSSGSGSEQVPLESFYGTAPNNIVKNHILSNLPITKSGYLYIYVSNETPNIDVFYDNLQVTHIRGALLEETHYYPFGLIMSGISYRSYQSTSPECGCPINKNGYNGNELQSNEFSDGSGLEVYDFNARAYDQQLGRFVQIDPLADYGGQENLTSYHFSYNNPTTFNDPTGLCPPCAGALFGGVAGFIVGAYKYGFKKGGWKKVLATTVGGAIGGATFGLGTGAIASAGGIAYLGAANVAMATGATSIGSAVVSNLTEQGISMVLGAQNDFDSKELVYSMVLAIPETILSNVVVDPLANSVKSELSDAIKDGAINSLTAKERGKIVKDVSSTLRKELGTGITRKESNIAAEKIVNLMQNVEGETIRVGITITNKAVNVTTVIVGNVITETSKDLINKQTNKD